MASDELDWSEDEERPIPGAVLEATTILDRTYGLMESCRIKRFQSLDWTFPLMEEIERAFVGQFVNGAQRVEFNIRWLEWAVDDAHAHAKDPPMPARPTLILVGHCTYERGHPDNTKRDDSARMAITQRSQMGQPLLSAGTYRHLKNGGNTKQQFPETGRLAISNRIMARMDGIMYTESHWDILAREIYRRQRMGAITKAYKQLEVHARNLDVSLRLAEEAMTL